MSLRDELPNNTEPTFSRHNPLRAEIESLVDQYLRAGGSITVLPAGHTAEATRPPRRALQVSPKRPVFDD